MIKSQINNLILGPSFGHNLCFKYANGSCEPILDILVSRTFHWYKELFNLMHFDPLQLLSENSRVYRESNSQSGSSFGSVGVHSLTRSYTLESMKRDSQADLFIFFLLVFLVAALWPGFGLVVIKIRLICPTFYFFSISGNWNLIDLFTFFFPSSFKIVALRLGFWTNGDRKSYSFEWWLKFIWLVHSFFFLFFQSLHFD
jgi:hypothetical protein